VDAGVTFINSDLPRSFLEVRVRVRVS